MKQQEKEFFCPDEGECLTLLNQYGTPPHVIAHCKAVARVADRMGVALLAKGISLNLSLIHGAALLHDIARVERDHPQAGAVYLRQAGCDPRISDIIAVHMDLPEEQTHEITEAVVVYLADKLVEEDKEVSLAQRYEPRMARAEEPLRSIIRRKYEIARRVYQMVQNVLDT